MIAIAEVLALLGGLMIGYLIGRQEVKRLRRFYKEQLDAKDDRIGELTLENQRVWKLLEPPNKGNA